jgi:hypothetical protein
MKKSVSFKFLRLRHEYLYQTPWSRVLFEELIVTHLVKRLPASCGIRRFITLSWAKSTQSTPADPTSLIPILIVSSHLHLGLPSGVFLEVFLLKFVRISYLAHRPTCYVFRPTNLFLFNQPNNTLCRWLSLYTPSVSAVSHIRCFFFQISWGASVSYPLPKFEAYFLRRTFTRLIKECDADDKICIKEYWRQFNIKMVIVYVSRFVRFWYTRRSAGTQPPRITKSPVWW